MTFALWLAALLTLALVVYVGSVRYRHYLCEKKGHPWRWTEDGGVICGRCGRVG